MPDCLTTLLTWPAKRWLTAIGSALVTFAFIGLPTDVIPNPVFGRAVAVTSWSLNVLIISSVLSGLLIASYVKTKNSLAEGTSLKIGGVGGFLAFFAVGCPVCNKIALIALGYSGALQYFAPVQPYLAGASILLLGYALRKRLIGESLCAVNLDAKVGSSSSEG